MRIPPELPRNSRVDSARLQIFIERGWLTPPLLDGQLTIREVDIARAALIVDLADDMGINEEGIDLALVLLDQLYGMRLAISALIDALEAQPGDVKPQAADDRTRTDL